MIRSVTFNSYNIEAGDNISLVISADYPVTIKIKCFITHPPPPRFANCEEAGIHVLERPKTLSFKTSPDTFRQDGEIQFLITDAEGDRKNYTIQVKGIERGRGGQRQELIS